MARALRRPLARLFHRTVPATAARRLGAALIVAGVALPWVVAAAGGWKPPRPALRSGTAVQTATEMRPALVYVDGGPFLMGSPSGEVGRFDEDETQHRVQVSSFVMCETEVTQAQFVAVVRSRPCSWPTQSAAQSGSMAAMS